MEEPSLVVAVCTNRPLGQITPTLEALAGQAGKVEGTGGIVVASAVTDGWFAELGALCGRLGLGTARATEPGLSNARNEAVRAAGADVVAFLDDDAIPDPEWLEHLASHWRSAPREMAVIGGAIDPLWVDPPPDWMSEDVHIVFSLLDRGPGVIPLMPGSEDAWGVNVSFRSEPLREVGGFDPELGPVPGIPFFADETEVQRRLAAAGYRGIYAGDVRVRHAVTNERMRLRQVFKRRFYAGASMRITGQWNLFDGFARVVYGLFATPWFMAREKPKKVAVAVARAGSGLGVLAAPLVRRQVRAAVAGREGGTGAAVAPREPRVALLHANDPRDVRRGTERLLEDLAAGLAADGVAATAIVAGDGPREESERDGVAYLRVHRPFAAEIFDRHELLHVPAAARELVRGSFDIAHAFHPADALAAVRWGWRTNGRSIFTVPAFPPTGGPLRLRALRTAFSADAVVVPTEAVERAVLASFPGAITTTIAPGVDTARFTPGGERASAPTVFCAADIREPRKQVETLVLAFAILRRRLPEARLVLADPYPGRARPWFARVPGVEVLEVEGDEDLVAANRAAWVAALPARDEPFGLVLTEAMACGTPVLGADDGGIPELVGEGPQGWVAASGDVSAWIGALATALAEPPSGDVAAAARARAEKFSTEACVSGYERLYERLRA